MIHLYIEHLLNIKTLSIQASLSTVSNKETKATLSADGMSLSLSHEDEIASIQLPINISPRRRSNVKFTIPAVPSKELSFRVQLEQKPGVQNGGVLSSGDADSGNLVPWSAAHCTGETEIQCAQCSSVLVERGRIHTWKDLPSQGWAEMMEFWHCHKPHEPHDRQEDGLKKGYASGSKLAVESHVGLVDVVDFIFAAQDCKNISQSTPDSTLLLCTQCSSNLGSVEPSTQGFQLHKPYLSISLAQVQGSVSYPINKWLACQILAGVESQGVRKFTIQSLEPKSSKSYKIWFLTPDLTISSSAAPSPAPIRTMKVLWHDSKNEDDEASDMKKFLTESEIKLPENEALYLLKALQSNSLWIPDAARELQGWKVSLLERFTNEDLAQWTAEAALR